MSSFLNQVIPYLRTTGDSRTGEFLTALEEVLELGARFVVRLGGATVFASAEDFVIGPKGLGVAGTNLLIPFDERLLMVETVPDHFHMPAQPSSRYRRTAFGYVSGHDRTFGMIARDDDMEPGRHTREALTDAIGNMKKVAYMEGMVPTMTFHYRTGKTKVLPGVTIGENGVRSSGRDSQEVLWEDVRMFEIADRVRMTCPDAVVEIAF